MSKDNKGLRNFVKRFVNPVLRNLARGSRGPFALLRHVGRRSGKTYEIPIMVWQVSDGFIIALTYGPQVDWLRNLRAAEQGSLRWHKREYVFQKPEFVDAQTALSAFPSFIRQVLSRLGTHEFVKLTTVPTGV
ncbi:nitroreductase family deazaflavin-dependent oxidoreductase [Ktedonospora formicarum]|uniref:Nitroreductase n=1 Tax=Ktedonospora formicarum TaxID=2778364 RepID=A0A8J3IC55_9CHLR|nr:nitroreductase family deazaflavin-dependent oxidoreductase [Ktedonospora formicarum]GHO49593.1 nitroreductase [Ktedonospora formicarum]